jgi:RHS repeat-associated protein
MRLNVSKWALLVMGLLLLYCSSTRAQALPLGWSDGDVGTVGFAGSATYSTGTFTVKGSGSSIYGTADGMNFAYQSLSGDGTIVARLVSVQGGGTYYQAGVMIRETLNEGSTNAYSQFRTGQTYFFYRPTTDGSTSAQTGSNTTLPRWFKTVRSGGTFSAFSSADGITWTQIGSSQTITMATDVYIGLAVTSADNSLLATATFDNVSVSSQPTPVITSLSVTSGVPGTQVTLSGSGFGASQGSSIVTVDGLVAPINSWSTGSVSINIPVGSPAGPGPVALSIGPSMNASNPMTFSVLLPGSWSDQDVGSVNVFTGSASYVNGLFTVQSTGNGVGPFSGNDSIVDGFHFVYQALSGDGTIVARVVSQQGYRTSQAGLMMRETLNSNATNVLLSAVNTSPPSLYLFNRASTGVSESYGDPSNLTGLPYWLKLVRAGSTFSAYMSLEGDDWVQMGSSVTVAMAQAVYVGLAVSGTSGTIVGIATFDNVSISSSANPAPGITSVSATTGKSGSQVTISGSGFGTSQGASVVLLNDAPVTINTWTSGSIDVTIPIGATSGYLVVAVAPSQNSTNAIPFTITSQPLPSGWLDDDIGSPTLQGNASFASGVFNVTGPGNILGGTTDGFHFVYQPLNGDGTLVARITSISGNSAKVGLMVRETVDPSATNEFIYYYNNGQQIVLDRRTSPGASRTQTGNSIQNIPLPYWLKISRSGNSVSAYASSDGVNWSQVGWSQALSMAQSVYVGLAVSSSDPSLLATATFDGVSLSTPTAPAPAIASVSPTTGTVGTQVTITGSGFGTTQGSSTVLLNDAAVTISSWSATSIGITLPTGATSGALVVSVAPSMNDSNPVTFTVTSQPLGSGWLDSDVGSVGAAGSATLASGVFTVNGAGSSIGGTADGFHFVYQPLTNSGSIVARVVSTSALYTQAGVMMRETLDASSANTFTYYINEAGNGTFVTFNYRTIPGAGTSQVSTRNITLPYWVKLSRAANTFTAFASSDGVHWSQIGTPQTFVTAQNVYVGLAVSSGNPALSTATFDNVAISAGGSLPNPVITGIQPSKGAPGTSVTITGSGFGSMQGTVNFNAVPATSITSWDDGQIVAIVPSGTMTGPVSVQEANITATGPRFTLNFNAQLTDSLNNQTTYNSQVFGSRWVTVSSQGSGCSTCNFRGTINSQFDGNGNVFSNTDPSGHITISSYDTSNNLLSQSAQLDSSTTATTTYTYNSFGEVLTATDALSHITTNTYDTHGNLTSVTTPAPDSNTTASVTQFGYNALGELVTITDPLNNVTTITYFPTGLINTIKDAQNNVTTYGYDAHGNRTSVEDASNQSTTFAYDTGDRLTQITYPDTTTTQFGYDYRGRRHTVTDQNNKVTTYNYDDADRLTSVVDAATNTTTYGYDTEGNLTSIKDANNNTTEFTYDAFGRVTKTTFPSTHIETYGYDANNNLTSKTDRKNQTITYVYDALNRLNKKQYPDSTEVDYVYDLIGKIQSVNDPTGTYGFSYDNTGRLIGTSTSYSFLAARNFTENYTYDKASNRTSFTDPESGSTTYAYDTLNRLTTLTPPSAFATSSFGFSYDALSRRTQMTRPNNVTTNYTYDNLSRLLTVLHRLSGSTIDGASYTVDNAGNRTAKTDQRTAVTSNYGYDSIYQLLSGTQGGSTTESYTYDPVGNRTASLGVSSYTNNSSNELTSTSIASYTYDANGNTLTGVTGSNTTSYAWDYENRLTSVTLPGSGGTVSFKYDPLGRRIYKSSSSGTSVYAYDIDNLIEETNAAGTVVARYAENFNIDEPLAMVRSSATSYYHADGLGSVTSLSNAAGAVVQTYTYDSYGKQTASSGSLTNAFQFASREFDSETGLYFMRARYYDPATGRFVSEDPSVFEGGMNFYPYVDNNPINWFDPYGLQKRKSRKKPKPPADPCPKEKRCFFNWLDGPLGNAAPGLGTTKTLMFTMAAKEGGWTQPALDHNMPLNNPFGVNRIKNGQAVGNIAYPSLPDAINAWGKNFGDRVRGDTDPGDFVHDLQNPEPPGKPYNSVNPNYENDFEQVYNAVLKFMKLGSDCCLSCCCVFGLCVRV